jgi:hypothetical protein
MAAKQPKPRLIVTLTPEDQALMEPLRIKFGLRSWAAVVRKLVRDAAKGGIG